MCGIVGIVHREGYAPVATSAVQRMCDAIRHRGPDDEGLHVDGRVGLGMRRLSIIDLAGGHQPIYNEDRSKVIVYNGEIYNYRSLMRDLTARGHRFRTASDTETIVHLYEEYGSDCVQRLRGMFGFAIWDATAARLVLARDRFGMKPLYTVEAPWGIAFASELKALHALGLTGGDLDWDAIDQYFRLGYIPAPATPFLAVRKLSPGHVLEWREADGATARRYWSLPVDTTTTPRDPDARILKWLDESVRAHLVSDVPVAAFLSGGMDSSAVVSSWALAGETPHAFTARYHGRGAEAADETPLAQALARRYGAKLTVVDVEPRVRDLFEPIVRALDEPHADESVVPTWLLAERIASEYKVALAGTGGDELFGGYRRHLGLLLSEWYCRTPALLRRTASALADRLPEPRGGGLGVHRLKRFLRAAPGDAAERYFDLLDRFPNDAPAFYADPIRQERSGTAARQHLREAYREGGSPGGLRAALYLDYQTYLPDDLLHLSDRIAMAHSLEVRVPFVDHEFVGRVFTLPDRSKIGFSQPKRLLRRALRSRLPAEHFRAPKRGFVGPTAAWLRYELHDVLTDELSHERMARLGLFEPATVDGLLDDHLSGRQNREGVLWALLAFSTWHRLYVEAGPVASYDPNRHVVESRS
ncbi:MAG TPA: asparagine synthase (glutamine-hydrolyzing) [Gemmatimonadales bacterium]